MRGAWWLLKALRATFHTFCVQPGPQGASRTGRCWAWLFLAPKGSLWGGRRAGAGLQGRPLGRRLRELQVPSWESCQVTQQPVGEGGTELEPPAGKQVVSSELLGAMECSRLGNT